MQLKEKLTDLKIHIFFLLLFVYFISSINAPIFNPIYLANLEFNNILEFFNVIRSLSPLITFTILTLFIIYKIYQKNILISKINYLLLFYFIIQVFFLYLIPIETIIPGIYNNNFQDIYWVISGICAISFFIIFENGNNNLGKNCMFAFLLILFLVTCLFMSSVLKLYYYDNIFYNFEFKSYYYGNVASDPNTKLLNTSVPRTSGLSRNLTIFLIISLIVYFYYEGRKKIVSLKFKKINIYFSLNKKFLFCVIVVLLFFILNLQSRSTFLFLITLAIILILNYDNLGFFKKTINILAIFLVALFFHRTEPDLRLKITNHFKDKNYVKIEKLKLQAENVKKNHEEKILLLINSLNNFKQQLLSLRQNMDLDSEEKIVITKNIQLKIDNIINTIEELKITNERKILEIGVEFNSYSLGKLRKYLSNHKSLKRIDKEKLMKTYGLSKSDLDNILNEFVYKKFIYDDEPIEEQDNARVEESKKEQDRQLVTELKEKQEVKLPTNVVRIVNTTREINFYDSGRFYLWKQATKLIKANNYIYGYGPQADRKYIGENVSNTYFYVYLTAGIFGVISILAIIVFQSYMLFYNIFIFKIFKQKYNFIEKISIFFILFIYSRTIFENTFGIFSIDMLIFLFANYFISAYYRKNKKLKKYN